MKNSDWFYKAIDPARVALALGLAVGLGIAVHEGFLLVAGAIAVGAMAAIVANSIQDHASHRNRLAPQQR
jgi:xanthine/uracil permease